MLLEWVVRFLPIVNDEGAIEALNLIGVPIGVGEPLTRVSMDTRCWKLDAGRWRTRLLQP